jgi:hypothetical protein
VNVPTDLNQTLPYLIGMGILTVALKLFPQLGKLLGLDAPAAPATPPAPAVPAPAELLARPGVQRLLAGLTAVAAATPNRIDDLALALLARLSADHPAEAPK